MARRKKRQCHGHGCCCWLRGRYLCIIQHCTHLPGTGIQRGIGQQVSVISFIRFIHIAIIHFLIGHIACKVSHCSLQFLYHMRFYTYCITLHLVCLQHKSSRRLIILSYPITSVSDHSKEGAASR